VLNKKGSTSLSPNSLSEDDLPSKDKKGKPGGERNPKNGKETRRSEKSAGQGSHHGQKRIEKTINHLDLKKKL